jgi:hypothetical protein
LVSTRIYFVLCTCFFLWSAYPTGILGCFVSVRIFYTLARWYRTGIVSANELESYKAFQYKYK